MKNSSFYTVHMYSLLIGNIEISTLSINILSALNGTSPKFASLPVDLLLMSLGPEIQPLSLKELRQC